MGKWFTVKLIKKWSISKGKCIDHTWGFGKHQQDRRGSRPERKVFSAAWRSAFPVLPCSGVSWEQYSKPRRTALKEGGTGSLKVSVGSVSVCGGKRTNQAVHPTAPKFMKYILEEFSCESQVYQRWDTNANRSMVWTEEAVGHAFRTRVAFGGHYSWHSCYVAQMSSDFQMLSLRSPIYLHSYPYDSPLCSSPLGC